MGMNTLSDMTNDFPIGSTTHFEPKEHPGFYVVRFSDGTFQAMADRSPHRGQHVEWGNPRLRPGGSAGLVAFDPTIRERVFSDGDSTFLADGFTASGPAPRPLDPFPVAVEDGRLYVEPFAQCPWRAIRTEGGGSRARWCNPRGANPEPLERCSRALPVTCWTPRPGRFGYYSTPGQPSDRR
jgi:nitrite reductase/ring-hydroxylating ferredoxin subunit